MEEAKTERFSDIVFSWSLEDIFNENLYKNQVEKIPESFHSVWQYFGSYIHPLLEETRAQVHSSMETIDRAPFAEVVGFEECNPHGVGAYGKNVYDIKVDCWRNRFSNLGKEPYKTLPGDLFVLADAKPETVSDLQRVWRSWAFVSVTNVSENENEDDTTFLYFKVKASKEFEVNDSTHTSLFLVFLVNLIPNGRIWKALRMSGNQKIIKEVLCTDSVNDGIRDKWLVESSSWGLNESQTGAVLACLEMLHCDSKSTVQLIWGPPGTGKTKTTATLLFTLLQMNCRTVICAPTNVAITEVASRFLKIVTKAESKSLFCSLGEVLLFGNKERLKVGAHIEDIYLNYRVKKLGECLGPVTGWRSCFASMIDFLEDCVSHYHVFLENELTEEKEHNGVTELKEKECRSDTELIKGKCKSFLEFFRDRFVSTALPLRDCISTLCTHIAKNYISEHNFQNMILLICLVETIEFLLAQKNVVSEALEHLCSRSEVEDVPESFVDNSFQLCIHIRECLSVLRTLQDSLSRLHLPNVRNEESLMEFCFQRASLIFCTVSSSYKLHRVEMEPLTIAVIDEAAQLKECESTITLQLPGVKHAVLVGDECQLPATVKSNVSNEAGFSRSLFERLSSMGHSKHLLNMQYRMHPSISFFPNSNFYNNQILDAPIVKKRSHE
ncbi:probable helicase senataxin, partial [Prunus avium]|uniref:Probable helicase senataxin n=1 Tax=Prunus avium TaxID=42229 RepID=A0A6P5RYD6_PRUAV